MATLHDDMIVEITLGKRNGAPTTIQACVGDFPANAIEKIFRYGFQRTFNDAVGGSDSTTEDKVKQARELIDRYKAGDVGRKPAESVDPLTAAIRKIFRARLKANNHPLIAVLKDMEPGDAATRLDEAFVKLGDKMPDEHKSIMTQAKAAVASAMKVATINVGNVDL